MKLQNLKKHLQRVLSLIIVLSIFSWVFLSIINPFIGLFLVGNNLFNKLHIISFFSFLIGFILLTLSSKNRRERFKKNIKNVGSSLKGSKKKDVVLREGCSKCKKKAESK